jgi:hypothetical protein
MRDSPAMAETRVSAAFRRAAEMFGGITPLSQWLRVPSESVDKWISGEELPPQRVYRQVTDALRARDQPALELPVSDSTPSTLGLGLRVLLAIDDRDTSMTLGVLLRSEGFELRLLTGVAEVVAAAKEFRPHAVLCDAVDEVARQLPADGHVALIAVTKPVHADELLRRLASLKR